MKIVFAVGIQPLISNKPFSCLEYVKVCSLKWRWPLLMLKLKKSGKKTYVTLAFVLSTSGNSWDTQFAGWANDNK